MFERIIGRRCLPLGERRARSIEPFKGGRWRLRRMRASGCTDLTVMGIESFFVAAYDFAWLRKITGKRKAQLKALPYGMT
jgi:hypothetical protein